MGGIEFSKLLSFLITMFNKDKTPRIKPKIKKLNNDWITVTKKGNMRAPKITIVYDYIKPRNRKPDFIPCKKDYQNVTFAIPEDSVIIVDATIIFWTLFVRCKYSPYESLKIIMGYFDEIYNQFPKHSKMILVCDYKYNITDWKSCAKPFGKFSNDKKLTDEEKEFLRNFTGNPNDEYNMLYLGLKYIKYNTTNNKFRDVSSDHWTKFKNRFNEFALYLLYTYNIKCYGCEFEADLVIRNLVSMYNLLNQPISPVVYTTDSDLLVLLSDLDCKIHINENLNTTYFNEGYFVNPSWFWKKLLNNDSFEYYETVDYHILYCDQLDFGINYTRNLMMNTNIMEPIFHDIAFEECIQFTKPWLLMK